MRCYRETKEKSWFFKQIENLVNVMFGKTDALPFGKSTAFLVGVGD
jgi:hypothetical protein